MGLLQRQRQRGEQRLRVGEPDPVGQQRAQGAGERGQRERIGGHRLDQRGRPGLEPVDPFAHLVRAEQLVRLRQQRLIGVGSDDRGGIDHEEALGNSVIARGRSDPQRGAIERGIAGRLACQPVPCPHLARVDREQLARAHLPTRDADPAEQDDIVLGPEIERIADAELRQDKAEIARQLLADAGDAGDQRGRLCLVDEANKAEAELDGDKRLIRHV